MKKVREPRRTLQEAVDLWLAEYSRRVEDGARSAETLFMHRENLKYLLRRVAPTTPIAVVDANLIDSIAVAEAEGQRARADGGTIRISARTVSKRMCSLRQVLDHSRRVGWIDKVPDFPKLETRYVPRHQHLRDFSEFERYCDGLPVDQADWIWTSVLTGQRPKDLHQLRAYEDCDPFARPPWIILRSSKTRAPDGLLSQMPGPLAARLRERFKREQLQPGDLVVQYWPKDERGRVLRRRSRETGIDVTRAADFRRTCGSWAAHKLGSLTIGLKDYLGHTSFAMLSRVYARALPPGLGDVARALAAQARRPKRRKKKLRVGPTNPSPSAEKAAGDSARLPPKKRRPKVLPAPTAVGSQTGGSLIPPRSGSSVADSGDAK